MKGLNIRIFALILVAAMVFPMLAACNKPGGDDETQAPPATEPQQEVVKFEGDYTYNASVSTMASNWNPHVYQTTDDSYPLDFITDGLYSFIFNDALHPLEGKKAFEGYVIVPEMAASMPRSIICQGDSVTFLNAETSGVFLTEMKCGVHITKGQVLGQIVDPLRGKVLSTVKSPVDGYLFTIRAYPIVYEGSLMARIFNSEAKQ